MNRWAASAAKISLRSSEGAPMNGFQLQWPLPAPMVHGGPDGGRAVRWDFSTNSNPLGPLPEALQAVREAPREHYPDPSYRQLREQVAQWHGAEAAEVVPAGSANEWIWRFTGLLRQAGGARRVWLPQPAYGEYRAAAVACGAACLHYELQAAEPPPLCAGDLLWLCEPHNPTGRTLAGRLGPWLASAHGQGAVAVLDLAYAPLRLDGRALPPAARQAWQLWSPNKACGLTGVRGAYAIAPAGQAQAAESLRRHAPGWVLGADGEALIRAFCSEPVARRLAAQRAQLDDWCKALREALLHRGWRLQPGVAPFVFGLPPGSPRLAPLWHAAWRSQGLKLRDAASFGLPGWVRIAALEPAAQQVLLQVCDALHGLPVEDLA